MMTIHNGELMIEEKGNLLHREIPGCPQAYVLAGIPSQNSIECRTNAAENYKQGRGK
jgi:hypothetical protein